MEMAKIKRQWGSSVRGRSGGQCCVQPHFSLAQTMGLSMANSWQRMKNNKTPCKNISTHRDRLCGLNSTSPTVTGSREAYSKHNSTNILELMNLNT